ncbi:unnamed protein product, partial [Urochloa humidicola]
GATAVLPVPPRRQPTTSMVPPPINLAYRRVPPRPASAPQPAARSHGPVGTGASRRPHLASMDGYWHPGLPTDL